MPTLVDTSVFGLYEIFSNVIPGLIVLVTLWGFVESVWRAQIQIPDPTIFLVFFVFLSYIVGFVIQALSCLLYTSDAADE